MIPPKPPDWFTTKNAIDSYYDWVLDHAGKDTYLSDLADKILAKQHDAMKQDGHVMSNPTVIEPQSVFNEDETKAILNLKTKASEIWKDIPWTNYLVVAGGCFASWFHGEHHKDIDIFILSDPTQPRLHESIKQTLTERYPKLSDDTAEYVRSINKNVLSVLTDKNKGLQFIFVKHQKREELIADFDFLHCTVSFAKGRIFLARSAYDAIKNKYLVPNKGKTWKDIADWRREKFKTRGWTEHDAIFTAGPQSAVGANPYANSLNPFKNGQARVNPMRTAPLSTAQAHLDKLLDDLDKNGV